MVATLHRLLKLMRRKRGRKKEQEGRRPRRWGQSGGTPVTLTITLPSSVKSEISRQKF